MSRVLNYLLSGGRFRAEVAVRLHAVVWASRSYGGRSDSPEMRLLDQVNLTGRTAIDVGAHAGNWTLNLARRVGPKGSVLAYEALPHYGRALSMSVRLLGVRNVKVKIVAVGEREGFTALRWRTDNNELLTGKTHIEPGTQPSSGVVEVQIVTLDRELDLQGIRPSDVGFVKIDVEGAELEVLRGASGLLSQGRPALYLEVEPRWLERMGHSVEDIFSTMENHGYQPNLVSETSIKPTNAASYLAQYANRRECNNVLFLPISPPMVGNEI